jgi:hypothetical protein
MFCYFPRNYGAVGYAVGLGSPHDGPGDSTFNLVRPAPSGEGSQA